MAISYVSYTPSLKDFNESKDSDKEEKEKNSAQTQTKESLKWLKGSVGPRYWGEFNDNGTPNDTSDDYFFDSKNSNFSRKDDLSKYREVAYYGDQSPKLIYGALGLNTVAYDNKEIVDVYSKNAKLKKVLMYQLLNWGWKRGKLKKNTFGINMGMEWLSGIVLYLEENNKRGDVVGRTSGSKFKDACKRNKNLSYERYGGRDNERKKIANILQAANNDKNWFRKELIKAARVVKSSGFVWYKALKQRYNFQKQLDSGQYNKSNILFALCDYDGSGVLASAKTMWSTNKFNWDVTKKEFKREYIEANGEAGRKDAWKRFKEERRSQKKLGSDVGTIFGPEMANTINDSLVELTWDLRSSVTRLRLEKEYYVSSWDKGKLTAENIVVYNILRSVRAFCDDDHGLDKKIGKLLWKWKIINCNRDVIYTLAKEYPGFQPIFAHAMESMNGSPRELSTNLQDNLMGKFNLDISTNNLSIDGRRTKSDVTEFYKNYMGDNEALDAYLKSYSKNSYVTLKTRMPMFFYTFLWNMEFSAIDGLNQAGSFDQWYATKQRQINEKESVLKEAAAIFLWALLQWQNSRINEDETSLWISVNIEWYLANYKWKYRVAASWWLEQRSKKVVGHLRLWVARQLNYKKVVSFSFDELLHKRAHYVGVEVEWNQWSAGYSDVRVGVFHDMDKNAAIMQRHNQLEDVTVGSANSSNKYLFDLSDRLDISNKKELTGSSLKDYLSNRLINMYSGYTEWTKIKTVWKATKAFLYNNRKYLTNSIDVYVEAMKERWYFDKNSANNINSKNLDDDDKMYALENTLHDFAIGTIYMSRNSLLAGLHEKLTIEYWGGLMAMQSAVSGSIGFYGQVTPKVYLTSFAGSADSEKFAIAEARSGLWHAENKIQFDNIDDLAYQVQTKFSVPMITNSSGKLVYSQDGKDHFTGNWNVPALINVKPDGNGRLVVTLDENYANRTDKKLSNVIDVRAKNDVEILKNIKREADGTLIIWDVGIIDVQSIKDGDGVRNILTLGRLWTNGTNDMDNVWTVPLVEWHNSQEVWWEVKSMETAWKFKKWTISGLEAIVDDMNAVNSNVDEDTIKTILWEIYKNGKLESVLGVATVTTGLGKELTGGTLKIVAGSPAIVEYIEDKTTNKLTITYEEESGVANWTADKIKWILDASNFNGNDDRYGVVYDFIESRLLNGNSTGIVSAFELYFQNPFSTWNLSCSNIGSLTGGTLLFTEKIGNKIVVTYDKKSGPLVVKYEKLGSGGSGDTEEITSGWEFVWDVKDLQEASMLWGYYSGLSYKLCDEESNDGVNYGDFLKQSSHIIDNDGQIDNKEFENAWASLDKVIDNTDSDVKKLKKLYKNWNEITKVYIITRMKAVLAMEDTGNKTIKNLIEDRWSVFLSNDVVWPSENTMVSYWFDLPDYLKVIRNGFKSKASASNKFNDIDHWERRSTNQIARDSKIIWGFTAFYRSQPHWYPTYSSTPSFDTRVLWDFYSDSRDDNWNNGKPGVEEKAKDWLIDNLDKSKYQRMLIVDALNRKIKKEVTGFGGLSEKQIITLLRGDFVDIWGKKVTVDVSVVFYLLDECGNESLWFNLRSVTIEEDGKNNNWDTYEAIWDAKTVVYPWEWERSKEFGIRVVSWSTIVTQVANTHQVKRRVDYANVDEPEKEPDNPLDDDPDSTPGDSEKTDELVDDPDSTPGDDDIDGPDSTPGDDDIDDKIIEEEWSSGDDSETWDDWLGNWRF